MPRTIAPEFARAFKAKEDDVHGGFLARLATGDYLAVTKARRQHYDQHSIALFQGRDPVMRKDRPNILFFMTDHQRADSLGMVQAGLEATPHLNELASRSVVFTRAYNTCPLCVPARTALATGIYPTKNGVVFNDWQGTRARDNVTIQQHLHENGYHVAQIGVDHIRVRPGLRDRVPFAAWVGNEDYVRYAETQGVVLGRQAGDQNEVLEKTQGVLRKTRYSNTAVSLWPYPVEHFKDVYYCRRAVEFIHGNRERPFALFVNLWAPHPPLRLPEPYASLFPPDALDLPANIGLPARGEPPRRRGCVAAQLAAGVSMDGWRRVWAAHLGLVRLADDGLGRILRALEETGIDDRTVVIFTVDHGDHLGQHGMYQKMELYEQSVRVPLVVHMPGGAEKTFAMPVSHLDVFPTLTDLAGTDPPAGLDGMSLSGAINTATAPPGRSVFCQYSGNPDIGEIRRAVVARRYKYVYDPDDAPELYDLEEDPLEMENLVSDNRHAGIRRRMHEECRSWAQQHGDWVAFQSDH